MSQKPRKNDDKPIYEDKPRFSQKPLYKRHYKYRNAEAFGDLIEAVIGGVVTLVGRGLRGLWRMLRGKRG